MDYAGWLRGFGCEWGKYLKKRGHRVRRVSRETDVLISRNGRKRSYRWVMLVSQGRTKRLTASDHENIQRQLRLGRKGRERVYVVIRFDQPSAKVVVLPAIKAVKMRIVKSEKGGIPWGQPYG